MAGPDTLSAYAPHIVGHDATILTPYGEQQLTYVDWAASGREYRPINDTIIREFGPYIANTHTETNATGATMTGAYHRAREIIKEHVGANTDDALVMAGSGMTSAVVLLQRMLEFVHKNGHSAVLDLDAAFRLKIPLAD